MIFIRNEALLFVETPRQKTSRQNYLQLFCLQQLIHKMRWAKGQGSVKDFERTSGLPTYLVCGGRTIKIKKNNQTITNKGINFNELQEVIYNRKKLQVEISQSIGCTFKTAFVNEIETACRAAVKA